MGWIALSTEVDILRCPQLRGPQSGDLTTRPHTYTVNTNTFKPALATACIERSPVYKDHIFGCPCNFQLKPVIFKNLFIKSICL